MSKIAALRVSHDKSATQALLTGALLLAILLISAVFGLVAGIGNVFLVLLIVAGVLSLFLITQPVLLIWLALLFTLVIAGMTKYFAEIERIWWVAYGVSFILFVSALASLTQAKKVPGGAITPATLSLTVLVLVMVLSTALARPPVTQIMAAVKSLVMMGGVWFALAALPLRTDRVRQITLGLLLVGLSQWPLALYQYVFVRSDRLTRGLGTIEASDSVVGTFGGGMESGGLGAVLALYLVGCIIGLQAAYHARLVGRSRQFILLAMLGVPLLLMEVKVVFVYLPVALAVLYSDQWRKRPFAFLGGSTLVAVALSVLLLSYQSLHWAAQGEDIGENLEHMFSYSFEERAGYFRSQKGHMTRRELLEYWWQHHGLDDPLPLLVGHGLGSARLSGLVVGEAAKANYPMVLDTTGMSIFLWEVGLVGVLLIGILLTSEFLHAGRLSRHSVLLPWQCALASAIQATISLFALSLLYRPDIPYAAPMMFMVMMSFGLLAWLEKQTHELA